MTTTHQSLYKKKKTFLNGGIDILNNKFNNNKQEKTSSFDSLEDMYLKENTPSKNSVFNIRTRNMIKTNGFLQRLSTKNELKSYNKLINEKMGVIKDLSRKNKKEIYLLDKKKKEINKMSNDLILYNNPNINLNSLQKKTYNSFVKYMINKQVKTHNEYYTHSKDSDQIHQSKFKLRTLSSIK